MKPFRRNLVFGVLAALLSFAARARSAQPVHLTVQSDPVGASVVLDDKQLRVKTPLRLNVPPGIHEIKVQKAGFKESSRKIEVYAGDGYVSFQLEPEKATAPHQPATAAAPAPRNTAPKTADAASKNAAPPRGKPGQTSTIEQEAAPLETASGPVLVRYRGGPAEEEKPSWNLLPVDSPFPTPQRVAKQTPPPERAPAEEPVANEDDDGVFALVVRGQDPKQAALADETQGDTEDAGEDQDDEAGSGSKTAAPVPAAKAPAPAASESAGPEASIPAAPRCLSGDSAAPGTLTEGGCIPAPEIEWPASAEDLMYQAARGLPQFPEKFNVLLLGLDRRDRKGMLAAGAPIPDDVLKRKPANSDVIAVVQLDFIAHQVRVVSIPRDTKVRIPGHGSRKINSAYAFGRENLSRRVVEGFLNVPIHRTVVVDWKGAKECIGLFKGLGLDYNGFSEQELFWHLRKRSFVRGDFHRIERQQTFLRYAAGEFMRMYNEARRSQGTVAAVKKSLLDMALKQGISAMDTDMAYEEAQLLAYAFRDYNVRDMTLAQVTGKGGLEGGSEEEGGVYFFNASSHHTFDEIVARAESASRNP